jgi:DNA-binding Lrp family transcriptional regulator
LNVATLGSCCGHEALDGDGVEVEHLRAGELPVSNLVEVERFAVEALPTRADSALVPVHNHLGPNDCLLHVAVRDMHELRAFILDRLTHRPEVAEVQTSTIYERTSKHVPESRASRPLARRSRK